MPRKLLGKAKWLKLKRELTEDAKKYGSLHLYLKNMKRELKLLKMAKNREN